MEGGTPVNGSAVLDTSVIAKWFRQGEVGGGDALEYRAAYLEGRLSIIVPTLLPMSWETSCATRAI